MYEVNDKLLNIFDKTERSPQHYTRIEVPVELIESHEIVNCFLYAVQNFKPQLLTFTCYEDYDFYGDHGLKFDIAKYDAVNIHGDIGEKYHVLAFSQIKDFDNKS